MQKLAKSTDLLGYDNGSPLCHAHYVWHLHSLKEPGGIVASIQLSIFSK